MNRLVHRRIYCPVSFDCCRTMLIEGAYSTAGILGRRDAVKATAKAAEALIDSAIA